MLGSISTWTDTTVCALLQVPFYQCSDRSSASFQYRPSFVLFPSTFDRHNPHSNRKSATNTVTSIKVLVVSNSFSSTLLRRVKPALFAKNGIHTDDDDTLGIHPSGNPYADPNYPDLEFVNYDDPEYQVDQGQEPSSLSTEAALEEMREERRRRNDEYQFQTYFADVLKNGNEIFGEWTVYQTSTFLTDINNKDNDEDFTIPPRLVKSVGNADTQSTLLVVTRGYKEIVNTTSPHPTDAERIRHVETVVPFATIVNDNNEKEKVPYTDSDIRLEKLGKRSSLQTPSDITISTYWPEVLKAIDFRGHQGIMVCGSAWTICTAVALHQQVSESSDPFKGPFSEYRAELGIQEKNFRLRLKFDYSILEKEKIYNIPPALHLKSITVCREAVGMWPSSKNKGDRTLTAAIENASMKEAFFGGNAGAAGGLYDPPLIKSEEQAGQYMLLDLEGKASVLFPYVLDQDPNAHNGEGWVHSLDWSPGSMRYQVDRKVNSGPDILGLRTLELSEVQSDDAETYRPRDGGQNMRQ